MNFFLLLTASLLAVQFISHDINASGISLKEISSNTAITNLSDKCNYEHDHTRGPRGPEGPQGPRGHHGKKGHVGSSGAAGPTGATGPQGSIGLTGATGIQGLVFTPFQESPLLKLCGTKMAH